jgi:hypothetical protein
MGRTEASAWGWALPCIGGIVSNQGLRRTRFECRSTLFMVGIDLARSSFHPPCRLSKAANASCSRLNNREGAMTSVR